MAWAARKNESEIQKLDLFGLLDCFRSGIFDEPSIAVRRVLQSGETYQRELIFPDRNQTLELRIALATERHGSGPNGNGSAATPLCLTIRVRDITRMKEFEQLKSDMISLMSHELRTPLTPILGAIYKLRASRPDDEDLKTSLDMIERNAKGQARIVEELLEISRITTGKLDFNREPTDLLSIIRSAISRSSGSTGFVSLVSCHPATTADRDLDRQTLIS